MARLVAVDIALRAAAWLALASDTGAECSTISTFSKPTYLSRTLRISPAPGNVVAHNVVKPRSPDQALGERGKVRARPAT